MKNVFENQTKIWHTESFPKKGSSISMSGLSVINLPINSYKKEVHSTSLLAQQWHSQMMVLVANFLHKITFITRWSAGFVQVHIISIKHKTQVIKLMSYNFGFLNSFKPKISGNKVYQLKYKQQLQENQNFHHYTNK